MNYKMAQKTVVAVSVVLSSTAFACGDDGEKFSAVPLTFDGFNPALNSMHYKLKPDPAHGWLPEDGDGARLFFNTGTSGTSQPCLQLSAKDEAICGTVAIKAWMKKVGVDKGAGVQIAITDSKGTSVGNLEFKDPPGAYIRITPKGSSDYIQLTDTTRNLNNTNYEAGLKIEARKDLNAYDITAKRDMMANGTSLQNYSKVRCISIAKTYPDYRPIELTGHQVALGNSLGDVLKVTTPNGTVVSGYRDISSGSGAAASEKP